MPELTTDFTSLPQEYQQVIQLAQESIATLSQNNQDISIESWDGVNINAIFLNEHEIVSQTSQEMMAYAKRSSDRWDRSWALIWLAYSLVLKGQVNEALCSQGAS
jgi:hypothetical protein